MLKKPALAAARPAAVTAARPQTRGSDGRMTGADGGGVGQRGRGGMPAVLAPFAVRSFRFQWPADLLTSWASEMEIIILGWYILTTTGSVLLLTLYGALQ